MPFRFIRFSWLLLVQLLVLACLSLALGRPAISDVDPSTASVVLLIDRSASMSARIQDSPDGGPTTRFEAAKQEALQILDRLPSHTRVLVAGFASQASALTGFSRDRGLVRQAISGLPPTDEPADLSRAFELVRAFAGQTTEGDANNPPRILLLSDGGFDPGAGAGGVGRSTLEFVGVGTGPEPTDPPDNIGIVALGARRDYEDPSAVRLFVRLQSVVGRDLAVPIECRVGTEIIESTTLAVGAGTSSAPADAAKTIEFQNTEGGVVTVTLGRADDLDSDNIAGLVLRRPASVRLLLVRPNIAMDAVDEVVRAAVESLGPASLRTVNAGEYERLGNTADVDLILFDRVRPATLPATPSISFGATVPIPGLGVSESGEGDAARATGFIYWLRSHPLMRYVVLNEVWVARPMRMTLPEENTGRTPVRTIQLATGEFGPLIVLVEHAGVRRVVVGFDVGQSNWVKDAGFHIFLKNAVDYLTLSGEEEAGLALRTTETFGVRPAPGASEIEVTGPTSFARDIPPTGERVSLGPLPRVGIHEIKGVLEEDSFAAVNLLDPTESRITAATDLRLAAGDVRGTTASAAAPREIWHWFALAALVALCIEWMLYAWRMRV